MMKKIMSLIIIGVLFIAARAVMAGDTGQPKYAMFDSPISPLPTNTPCPPNSGDLDVFIQMTPQPTQELMSDTPSSEDFYMSCTAGPNHLECVKVDY